MTASYLFLATEGFPPTVIDAQMGDLLRVLGRNGVAFDALVFDPLLPKTLLKAGGRAAMKRLADAVPGRLVTRPYVPYEDRVGAPLARRLLLRHLRARPGRTVIHARGLWAAWLACGAFRAGASARVIYDCRGDVEAEHAFHVTGQGAPPEGSAAALRAAPGLARIRRAEATVLRDADRVLAVSSALRDVLDRRAPGVASRADVIPCGHDPGKFALDATRRAEWRARLRLEDRWVLAYAGSLVPYQLPEQLVRAGQLARAARPDAHLLLITPEVERARALLAAAGLGPDAATALAAAHGDVPGLLNAADAALLLRRRDPVNAVASPTKLAEYLACGLPVLVSDGIGDASALVRGRSLGVVLSDVDDPVALERAVRELAAAPPRREAAAAAALEVFARDRFLDVYLRLYRGLAEG